MKILFLINLVCGIFICALCFPALPKLRSINIKFNQLKGTNTDESKIEKVAVMIIDHGSKLNDANVNLEKVKSYETFITYT